MISIATVLPYVQIGLSVIVIALVLLQQTETDLGSAFGGGDSLNAPSHTRRGAEKVIFISTIVAAVLFAASSFAALIIR